jgi:hypothetical protein
VGGWRHKKSKKGKMPGIGRVVSILLIGIPLIELKRWEGSEEAKGGKERRLQGEGSEGGGEIGV